MTNPRTLTHLYTALADRSRWDRLISEGWTPDDIVDYLTTDYGIRNPSNEDDLWESEFERYIEEVRCAWWTHHPRLKRSNGRAHPVSD